MKGYYFFKSNHWQTCQVLGFRVGMAEGGTLWGFLSWLMQEDTLWHLHLLASPYSVNPR